MEVYQGIIEIKLNLEDLYYITKMIEQRRSREKKKELTKLELTETKEVK